MPVEDTVAIMHLVLAGLPARCPRMRILASHLGGALPLLPRRLDDHLAFESPGPPNSPRWPSVGTNAADLLGLSEP
ncbi:hypothetical protein ACGFNX_11265 [Streptomyces sp. NPDC048723]|uniref:hypothetical protein n=1 Tax=unclassified Streptomyces TaxID=2593676 RepID=UPI000AD26F62